ncbi:MAG: hypothetical protein ACRC8S_06880 [Fimbriiglobus sp.]
MYFGTDTTVTVKGEAWRPTLCEKCSRTYFYVATREVEASAHSPFMIDTDSAGRRAERKANERLQRRLNKATDAVPCPTCGWYQANMTKPFRELHYDKLGYAGLATLAASGLLLFIAVLGVKERAGPRDAVDTFLHDYSTLFFAMAGIVFVCGIGLVAARDILRSRLEPNVCQTEEERIRIGQMRAFTEEQFLSMNPGLLKVLPSPTKP